MNVLVYVCDALRSDHVSCYGYDRETTPTIDALAEDGIRYTNCYTPSTWTKPVGASLLTGVYPPIHGTRGREDVFDTDVRRLPETLSAAGYETAGFSTMGNVSASLGYDQGFDEYHDLYRDPAIVRKRSTVSTDAEELHHEQRDEIALPRADDLTDYLVEWLRDDPSRPFFAFAWSIEPHVPYDPPAEFRRFVDASYDGPVDGTRASLTAVDTEADLRHLEGLYDGAIAFNDDEIGAVVDALRSAGLYDSTTIVVLGDHGDAFEEHGQLTHGHVPYEELIRVPLVVKPAEHLDVDPGVVDEVACLVDLPATIRAAVGVDDAGPTDDGRPLPPFGPPGSSEPVYSETALRDVYPAFYSIIEDGWKYIEVDRPDRSLSTVVGTLRQLFDRQLLRDVLTHPVYYYRRYTQGADHELYDLAADPNERTNLADEHPDLVASLSTSLDQWRAAGEQRGRDAGSSNDGDIDDATAAQLKELGYLE